MSDGDYAEMIEIPVSTCEMVIVPKKRKKKNVKKAIIEKVNKNLETEEKIDKTTNAEKYFAEDGQNFEEQKTQVKAKKRFKFDIVTAQVFAIFVLVVAILLTNIFWEDSGMNNLIRTVFNSESKEEQVDQREYSSFTVYSPSKAASIEIEEGVMTLAGEGAIYSPCLGVVDEIKENNGKYTVTINHSDIFKTIIRNADYAYFDVGETVYQAVPVCYSQEGAQVLMYNNNTLLTNYTIADGVVVWQS